MAASRAGQGIETENQQVTEDIEDTQGRDDTVDQLATGQDMKSSEEKAATGITNQEDMFVVNSE